MTDPGEWRENDRVLAPWEAEWLYPGVVLHIDDDVAFVRYDDGDRALVPVIELRPVALEEGDVIHSRPDRDRKQYMPAQVLDVDDENLRVRYRDGSEDFTTVSYVRVPARRVLQWLPAGSDGE